MNFALGLALLGSAILAAPICVAETRPHFPDVAGLLDLAAQTSGGLDQINQSLGILFPDYVPMVLGVPSQLVPVRDGAVWDDLTWVATNTGTVGKGPFVECSRSGAASLAQALPFASYAKDAPRPEDNDLAPVDRMTWNQVMELKFRSISTGGVDIPEDVNALLVCIIRYSPVPGLDFDSARFVADLEQRFALVDLPKVKPIYHVVAPNLTGIVVARDAQLGEKVNLPNMFLNIADSDPATPEVDKIDLQFFVLERP